MLNDGEKTNLRFKIQFGNLKEDFKNNYYLATEERAVENSIVECAFIAEQNNNKYAITVDECMGVTITRHIHLDYFEEWHYICINKDVEKNNKKF